jgi:hypothetical protein
VLLGFKAALYTLPLISASIAVAETPFFLVHLPYRAYLQREALHPPALSRSERKNLLDLCSETIPDGDAYLKKWFLGAPAEDINREKVKEYFLWTFFNRGGRPGQYVARVENVLG